MKPINSWATMAWQKVNRGINYGSRTWGYTYHGVFPAEKNWRTWSLRPMGRWDDSCCPHRWFEASIHYGILAEQLTGGCRQKKDRSDWNGGLSMVQKIFESYAFVEKSSSGVEKTLGSLFLATRDLFGDNRTGENRPLLGLAPIWEINNCN